MVAVNARLVSGAFTNRKVKKSRPFNSIYSFVALKFSNLPKVETSSGTPCIRGFSLLSTNK